MGVRRQHGEVGQARLGAGLVPPRATMRPACLKRARSATLAHPRAQQRLERPGKAEGCPEL